MALASEHAYVQQSAWGMMLHGWAGTDRAEGITQIRQGLDTALAIGTVAFRPYLLALFAEVHAALGQPTEGLHILDEALELVKTTGARLHEAELYRLRGELLPAASRPNPGSCAQLPAWPACGTTRASVPRPTSCWRRSMAGSPRALTPPISRRPRHYSTSWETGVLDNHTHGKGGHPQAEHHKSIRHTSHGVAGILSKGQQHSAHSTKCLRPGRRRLLCQSCLLRRVPGGDCCSHQAHRVPSSALGT